MDYHLQNPEISFLTSASEMRSASCPKPVKPWGRYPSTQRNGGWGCPRHSTDVVEERKIPWPCQESTAGSPAHSLATIMTMLSHPTSRITDCYAIVLLLRKL